MQGITTTMIFFKAVVSGMLALDDQEQVQSCSKVSEDESASADLE